jgi:hypothetical protein
MIVRRPESSDRFSDQNLSAQVLLNALGSLDEVYSHYSILADDCPFWYAERAHIGFLIQSARMNYPIDALTILQEFSVYNDSKYGGTGDLFYSIKKDGNHSDVMCEAKCYTTKSASELRKANDWMSNRINIAQNQLQIYYEYEGKYFESRKSKADIQHSSSLLTIVFEAFRDYTGRSSIKESKKYNKWIELLLSEYQKGSADYLSIYEYPSGNIESSLQQSTSPSYWRALAIYGRLETPPLVNIL